MNKTGRLHAQAQLELVRILRPFYTHVTQEVPFPVPNPKYVYDPTVVSTLTYWFDVFAQHCRTHCKYPKLGIEVDGEVGHKRTMSQYIRDQKRTDSLVEFYDDIAIFRFDPQMIVGRGYRNPKTKELIEPWTPEEILKILGILNF